MLHPKVKIKLITRVNSQWKQTRDKNASKLYSNSKYYDSPIYWDKTKTQVETSLDKLGRVRISDDNSKTELKEREHHTP